MPSRRLPERPDLGQLRRQAVELRDTARAGDPGAAERIAPHLSIRTGATVTLAAAQLVIAREHGFSSWPMLKAEVEARTLSPEQRADAFLEASVEGLTGRAVRLLEGAPQLAVFDISTAAVVGDASTARDRIARDPAVAVEADRRRRWPPLLYVCHSHWHRIDPSRANGMLEVARLLLDAGADPNANNGLRPRCGYRSALYGATGIANNPAITRLLLERGANPDDDESLYHSVYHAPDFACLRLLLEYGAAVDGTNAMAAMIDTGSADGVRLLLNAGADPGRPRPAEDAPDGYLADLSLNPLYRAIETHCIGELVALLLAAGADPNAPGRDGRTPLRLATRRGREDIAELLLGQGARDDATGIDRFLGTCARGDRAGAERLVALDPELVSRLSEEDLTVIVDAADDDGTEAVGLMLELGFPLEARNYNGATALHAAAYCGAAGLVRLLIERGADLESRDREFGGTPLSWATVGSGERPKYNPDGDWVGTVRALLDAGASPECVWVSTKPPSEEVAALLHAYGVDGEEES